MVDSVWVPCRICFNYDTGTAIRGHYRDNLDNTTDLKLPSGEVIAAGLVHEKYGKPQYRPETFEDRWKGN